MASQASHGPFEAEFTLNVDQSPSRISFLKKALADSPALALLDQLAGGNPAKDVDTKDRAIRVKLPEDGDVRIKAFRLKLVDDLAKITGEHLALTTAILADLADHENPTLRDVALRYGDAEITSLIGAKQAGNTGGDHAALARSSSRTGSSTTTSKTSDTTASSAMVMIRRNLFQAESNAVIVRMLEGGELTLDRGQKKPPRPKSKPQSLVSARIAEKAPTTPTTPPDPVQEGLVTVLRNKPDFDFRRHGLSRVLSDQDAFAGVDAASKPRVTTALKHLHLAQALTADPAALPVLFRSRLSASRVSQLPEQQFIANFGPSVGGEAAAADIHQHAVRVTARNDHALTSILQAVRGSGLAAIDGRESKQNRLARFQSVAAKAPEQINLEKLFGSLDYCECSDCTSVTSPAAYFVELLQFLRNNNLDTESPWSQWSDTEDFSGSPLDFLFRRRPDLACLELTCANTNTVLPYIDLANEVMESFIVHQKRFADSKTQPKQTWIDIFNASDQAEGAGGSTAELLAVPQNVNIRAYEILARAVYPASALPYNQPVDATRQLLAFLGTSRSEVQKFFRAVYHPPVQTHPDTWGDVCPHLGSNLPCPPQPCAEAGEHAQDSDSSEEDGSEYGGGSSDDAYKDPDEYDIDDDYATARTSGSSQTRPLTSEEQAQLTTIHGEALAKAVAAEELGITQEEYIILTKQAFWPKIHFDLRHGEKVSTETYRRRIGVRNDWEYWGVDYTSEGQMLDTVNGKGLTYVKTQFLPRTGIAYTDVVDLLRTRFINPDMPKGRALVIMQAIRFSYRFLAAKVSAGDSHGKGGHHRRHNWLRKLIEFLENPADEDEQFAQVWKDSLKKTGCCELLWQNRKPRPRRHQLGNDERDAEDVGQDGAVDGFDSSKKTEKKKHKPGGCQCGCDAEIRDWVCKYFEAVGKVIMLDSGEGQKLPWEGDVFERISPPEPPGILRLASSRTAAADEKPPGDYPIGHIHSDGNITESETSSVRIGYVSLTGLVYNSDGSLFMSTRSGQLVLVKRTDQPTGKSEDGSVDYKSVLHLDGITTPTPWTTAYDDCDLTKVRLQRLDDKPVTQESYDKMHRFLRLWRKLGWSMAEVDAAITAFGAGMSAVPGVPSKEDASTPADDDVDYGDFQNPCGCGEHNCKICRGKGGGRQGRRGKYCSSCGGLNHDGYKPPTSKHCGCKKRPPQPRTQPTSRSPTYDISPYLVTQIAALKRVVALTGLSILQVLSFWTSIDTHGSSSLYSQLFLTHNMLGIDRIFAPDADGNYLTQDPAAPISQHRPILLAAFHLKPDDLDHIIRISKITDDRLTLENVSAIYRHALLAKVLAIPVKDLDKYFRVFGIPWSSNSAQNTLDLLELWNKASDAGFDLRQLAYLFLDADNDPLRPMGPTKVATLQLATTLYTALKDIDTQHPAIVAEADATTDVLATNAQLLFSQATVADIKGFLEGTRIYNTNAPKLDAVKIPDNLAAKLKYTASDSPSVQTVGQLTDAEAGQAKAILPGNQKWSAAIDRLSKQALTFFNTVLAPVFPDKEAAKAAMVSGDEPATQGSSPQPGTAPAKRFYFLQNFIPFLRRQLTKQAVTTNMASAASLPKEICEVLLEDVLMVGRDPARNQSGTRAVDVIEAIKNDRALQTSWDGYLLVNTTGKYTLLTPSTTDDNQPAAISIDGAAYEFSTQQEDPTNVWYGQPIKLLGGKLYELKLADQTAAKLLWMTDVSAPSPIPSSMLIPAHATSGVGAVLSMLVKAALLIKSFSLKLDEVTYLSKNGGDFAGFDWNSISLDQWKRLDAYAVFRDSLPKAARPLLQLFTWAKTPGADAKEIPAQINAVTLWKETEVAKLIAPKHFGWQTPSTFANEIALVKLQKALQASQKIGIDINKLFVWARPTVDFGTSNAVAEDIKTVIRSKYTLSDWEQAIKPTYDTLRQNQSNALTAYLVVLPDLVAQGIIDADTLFEFFLIDPSMCPCMETSRLKQATSSVQLFIQRCLLGLEDQATGFGMGVPVSLIDRGRWEWMQRYRLWEANRKVYLFPENWIQPSLRDDKSPQYKALESEMLQKDINEQSVLNAMKNYLFALDEVANLEIVSIYVEDLDDRAATGGQSQLDGIARIHFFARTHSSPYKCFYRVFDAVYESWTPWSQMQVDVPTYEIERKSVKDKDPRKDPTSTLSGCYIVPFMFNGRLIVGLPQFMKKTVPLPMPNQTLGAIAQGPDAPQASAITALEYWEIKLGYTELFNGTWKQKVICADAVWEAPTITAPEVSEYQFITEIQDASNSSSSGSKDPDLKATVYINVCHNGTAVGRFAFNGSRIVRDSGTVLSFSGVKRVFQHSDDGSTNTVTSLQVLASDGSRLEYSSSPSVTFPHTATLGSTVYLSGSSYKESFNHSFIHALITKAASAPTLDKFFAYFQQVEDPADAWGGSVLSAPTTPPDPAAPKTYNELCRTYSLYNWEMAFHAPMALADKLLQTQQFELALKVVHFVFNPFATGANNSVARYWQMPPFRDIDSIDSLEKLFAKLQAGASVARSDPINQWRDNPFEPHVLARLRPVAYMKWTVMKYIEILIAYGDWYFQQNTLEMIPMAIQCYVLASHIYGQPGQKIPRRGKKRPGTYLTLLKQWDAFGNAMVQLELDFPFSNQTDKSWGESNGVRGLANIFGFATNRYFCIPNNDQLTAVRATISDRLYKIRHCQDIKGVVRRLPLYEPALDVGQLVSAAAQGLSLASVLDDLNAPMPNYHFSFLLAKALELCGELKALGAAFLAAKEKQDGEALSLLRQKHDVAIQALIMTQKKLARDEAQKNVDALRVSRRRPVYQMQHTLKLLGSDAGLVPDEEAAGGDFAELADDVPAPVANSGLLLSAEEREEMDRASDAKELNTAVGVIQAISSELHAFPTFNAHASPLGVGVAACWGPSFIAEVMSGMGQVMRIASDSLTYASTSAGRRNAHMRTRQDRVHTANTQGHEIKNIDAQIATQQARIAICDHEIAMQQAQMDNAGEVLDFLSTKYTTGELYTFLEGRVRTLYYQTYQMAYGWARKAETCFRFERGLREADAPSFIRAGYWEPGRDGLLSGEALFLGLKGLEAAYLERRGWDFEVSKHVSLRQMNPLALMALRETGSCEFTVPEVAFDMDFPGHYARKIRSVAVTVPCVAGPYTTVNCTLRLTAHKFRADPAAKDKRDYPEKIDGGAAGGDARFATTNVPITAVAVSSGANDAGQFELNFKDERFLPFEGAGAVSAWSLALPAGFRQFDYGSITDVVLHLRYTARDGGDRLAAAAAGALDDYVRAVSDVSRADGLFAMFDARAEFVVEWQAFQRAGNPPQQPRVLRLRGLNERLPIYTKGHPVAGLQAMDIWIVTDGQVAAGDVSLAQGSNSVAFTDAKAFGELKSFAAQGPVVISDWDIVLGDAGVAVSRLWILVRYVMK